MFIDDTIALSPKTEKIDILRNSLSKTIKIKDLGDIKTFLGIEVSRDRANRTISLY